MNDLEVRRYEMFNRVSGFGETHADAFASSALAVRLFAEVNETIDRLKAYSTDQISSNNRVRKHTHLKSYLRAELRKSLGTISRTARAIAAASGDRSFEVPFILPRNNLNYHVLIILARTIVDRVAPLAEEFAKYEMSSDYLEELKNNIELFNKAVGEQISGRIMLVTATAGIKQEIERGRAAVRQLDAIIRIKFSDNPAMLADWKSTSRTHSAPRRAAAKEPPINKLATENTEITERE